MASDLLTKAVTSMLSWKKFYNFMGMCGLNDLGAAEPSSCTESRISIKVVGAVLTAIAALGVLTTAPKVAKLTKVACAVSVAALAAWLVKKLGPGGIKKVVKRRPHKSQAKVHWVNHGGPAGRGSQKAGHRNKKPEGKRILAKTPWHKGT